ncbi:hypothetical protein BDP55DRAFT_66969 [Colletotrichum godetiae]|uniref:Uncharacterized protein n=1 Tax=Colletotrichum godetiae TaxID=1209918 RepID=A0AAJ0AQ70_9PEZI|nr:uncharacterized protein BDP55DRAFT_66969 [Colletotrichum godetiae]KAK1688349.1 hypothetical protein BDP55DRAFT_66969 [Colletotrichum godetiae]
MFDCCTRRRDSLASPVTLLLLAPLYVPAWAGHDVLTSLIYKDTTLPGDRGSTLHTTTPPPRPSHYRLQRNKARQGTPTSLFWGCLLRISQLPGERRADPRRTYLILRTQPPPPPLPPPYWIEHRGTKRGALANHRVHLRFSH